MSWISHDAAAVGCGYRGLDLLQDVIRMVHFIAKREIGGTIYKLRISNTYGTSTPYIRYPQPDIGDSGALGQPCLPQ
ncbi:hypothetical protein M408DRAFT_332255 [Serendipita vermifera MAFF 305830]|uniref:Uncharacterized protein n=1 Tax=Serendipita vermifera MAFF 305830 TaxID=933852 RepID=A0A0C3AG96_SERVB|nr:hypothetical protein M408DRAFT_332255 [Serendipita vermifera MAFF 305830]